jgi:hypothetical protein
VRTTTTFQVHQQGAVAGPNNNSWVWVYGSVNLGASPSTLSGGSYTGVFTISVAYP